MSVFVDTIINENTEYSQCFQSNRGGVVIYASGADGELSVFLESGGGHLLLDKKSISCDRAVSFDFAVGSGSEFCVKVENNTECVQLKIIDVNASVNNQVNVVESIEKLLSSKDEEFIFSSFLYKDKTDANKFYKQIVYVDAKDEQKKNVIWLDTDGNATSTKPASIELVKEEKSQDIKPFGVDIADATTDFQLPVTKAQSVTVIREGDADVTIKTGSISTIIKEKGSRTWGNSSDALLDLSDLKITTLANSKASVMWEV